MRQFQQERLVTSKGLIRIVQSIPSVQELQVHLKARKQSVEFQFSDLMHLMSLTQGSATGLIVVKAYSTVSQQICLHKNLMKSLIWFRLFKTPSIFWSAMSKDQSAHLIEFIKNQTSLKHVQKLVWSINLDYFLEGFNFKLNVQFNKGSQIQYKAHEFLLRNLQLPVRLTIN